VLVTGAFGNIGSYVVTELAKLNHTVICFDLENKKTKKKQKWLIKKKISFITKWGDLLDPKSVQNAIKDVGCVIHLAAILHPQTEKLPELSQRINVEGTQNLVNEANKTGKRPKIIFSSSFAVYGKRPSISLQPPIHVNDPITPTDLYSEHKIKAEAIIKESGLDWTFIRFCAVLPLDIANEIDPVMFEIPLDQRIEFIHPHDAAKALTHAIDNPKTDNRIFLGGGGEGCKLVEREMVKTMLEVVGLSIA